MKKLAVAALTLTMAFSMSTPAYAAGNITVDQASADIKASYQEGNTLTENVYSVDVNWGSLEYTYHPSKTKTWNTETLKYDTKGDPYWECDNDQNKITVTNHSNTAISTNFEYEQVNKSVNGTFDKTNFNLKSADGTKANAAPTETVTLTLDGSMAENEDSTVGSVKVTIGDFQPEEANKTIIKASYLKLYTTADDNVFTAQGTVIGNSSAFDTNGRIKLEGLKIHDEECVITPTNSVRRVYGGKTDEFGLEKYSSSIKGNSAFYVKEEGTYHYVLTINIETMKVTVTVTKVG